jgi:hypothetical protein
MVCRMLLPQSILPTSMRENLGISPIRVPPLVRPECYQVESRRKNVTFVCPVPKKGLDIAIALAERRPDIPFVFVESWPLGSPRLDALARSDLTTE